MYFISSRLHIFIFSLCYEGLLLFGLTHSLLAQKEAAASKAINLFEINSYNDDYLPQVSPDGQFLFFQSNRTGYLEESNIWYTHIKNSQENPEYSPPKPLTLPLDSPAKAFTEHSLEASPKIQKENASKKIKIKKNTEAIPKASLDFEKEARGKFTINTNEYVGTPCVFFQNNTPIEIYFTSTQKGNSRKTNIFFTRFDSANQNWTPPQQLEDTKNEYDDRMPTLSTDGLILIFSSNRFGGFGGFDLWMRKRTSLDAQWGEAINLGANLNTSVNEISPSLFLNDTSSASKGLFFFSSDRSGGHGGYDIYTTPILYEETSFKFLKIENMESPFNSSNDDEGFSTSLDGAWAYISSNRNEKEAPMKEGMDLYRIRLPSKYFRPSSILLTGQIIDASEYKRSGLLLGLEATIHVYGKKKNLLATSRVFHSQNKELNNFEIQLTSGDSYKVVVSMPGYRSEEFYLNLEGNIAPGKIERKTLGLWKRNDAPPATPQGLPEATNAEAACTDTELSCLKKVVIYFDRDSSTPREGEDVKINQVRDIVAKYKLSHITIEGHTDSTSTEVYNYRLSQRRASAIKKLLEAKGVKSSMLSIQALGFSRREVLIEKTDQDRALNRRVTFKISGDK